MKIGRKDILLYVGVCLALLPIILYRDFTPSNELRYLSIADESLSNGTFFAFTNHGLPYADKPPLYLWIVMLCRWLTGGHHMWLLSLFSLIPAMGVIAVMDRWVRSSRGMSTTRCADGSISCTLSGGLSGDSSGHGGAGMSVAGLMLMTCVYFLGPAVTLRMDMLMCLFIVLALKEFWNIREISSKGTAGKGLRRSQWLFPVWLFLALFTKGPYGILIPLFCTLVYLVVSREIRSVFRYWGWRTWLVLIVLCALWFGAVYVEGGTDYLNNLLFHQTVGRAVNSFHHKAPFYYYAVCIWYCIAPWSVLVPGALVAALCKLISERRKKAGGPLGRQSSDIGKAEACTASPALESDTAALQMTGAVSEGEKALRKYFVTAGLTTLVALSLFSSKLPVYLLPAFPFLVYGAAMYFPELKYSLWVRIALTVPAAVFALAFPGLFAAVFAFGVSFLNLWEIYLAAAVLSASGIWSLCLVWRGRTFFPVYVIVAGMLLGIFVCGWAVPEVNPQLGYGALCDKAMQLSREYGIEDIHTWRVSRPENMDVYLHRDVTIEPNEEEPAPAEPCLLLTRVRYLDNFPGLPSETVGPYAVIVCR